MCIRDSLQSATSPPPISRLPRYRHKAVYRTLTGLAEVYRPVVGEQIPPIRAKLWRRFPSHAIGGSHQWFSQSQPVSFTSAKIKKGVPIRFCDKYRTKHTTSNRQSSGLPGRCRHWGTHCAVPLSLIHISFYLVIFPALPQTQSTRSTRLK